MIILLSSNNDDVPVVVDRRRMGRSVFSSSTVAFPLLLLFLLIILTIANGFVHIQAPKSNNALQRKERFERTAMYMASKKQPPFVGSMYDIVNIPVQTLDGYDPKSEGEPGNFTVPLGLFFPDQEEGNPFILSCLSHYGDYNAWELTQQYMTLLDNTQLSSPIILVGIGSLKAAHKFYNDLELAKYTGRIVLVNDETGEVTDKLECYKGWLALDQEHAERWKQSKIGSAFRLFGMFFFGFGSPGTLGQIFYGIFGDTRRKNGVFGRQWVIKALLQGSRLKRLPKQDADSYILVPEDTCLRAFELATLRFQTGLYILAHWITLSPKNGSLLTQMGGTFVFEGGECKWSHYDEGIFSRANVQDVYSALYDGEDLYVTPYEVLDGVVLDGTEPTEEDLQYVREQEMLMAKKKAEAKEAADRAAEAIAIAQARRDADAMTDEQIMSFAQAIARKETDEEAQARVEAELLAAADVRAQEIAQRQQEQEEELQQSIDEEQKQEVEAQQLTDEEETEEEEEPQQISDEEQNQEVDPQQITDEEGQNDTESPPKDYPSFDELYGQDDEEDK